MLNSKVKLTAKQQALKDIADECRQQKYMNNTPVVYAAREKLYTSIFRFMAQNNPNSNQLILDI